MGETLGRLMPIARREGLIVQELADELLVYDRERHKAYCLNRTAALVWNHCDGKTATTEIAQRVQEELGGPIETEIVWLALKQLSAFHLLQVRIAKSEEMASLSRRRLLRRMGLSAAVAVPLIIAITAPMASAQTSCAGQGQSCATLACCAGCHCNPQSACVGSC